MSDSGSAPDPRPTSWFVGRCRTRPWRLFLTIWALLLLTVLVPSMVGSTRSADPPPTPDSILDNRYTGSNDSSPRLRRARTTSRPGERTRTILETAPDGTKRIRADQNERVLKGGWPRSWWSLAFIRAWDVTDRSRPFRPAPGAFKSSVDIIGRSITAGITIESGARAIVLGLDLPFALVPLTMPPVLAALVAVPVRWRARRAERRERAACLHCGHLRDPARRDAACAECGTPPGIGRDRSPAMRRRRAVIALLLLLPSLAVIGSFVLPVGRMPDAFQINRGTVASPLILPPRPASESIPELESDSGTQDPADARDGAHPRTSPSRARAGLAEIRETFRWTRGWPLAFVDVTERHAYFIEITRDGQKSFPMTDPTRSKPLEWHRLEPLLIFNLNFERGHRSIEVMFLWAFVVLELTLLHIITLPLLYLAGRIR